MEGADDNMKRSLVFLQQAIFDFISRDFLPLHQQLAEKQQQCDQLEAWAFMAEQQKQQMQDTTQAMLQQAQNDVTSSHLCSTRICAMSLDLPAEALLPLTAHGLLLLQTLITQHCSEADRAIAAEAMQRLYDRQATTDGYNQVLREATGAVLRGSTGLSRSLLHEVYIQQDTTLWDLLDAVKLVHQLPPLLRGKWMHRARKCRSPSDVEALVHLANALASEQSAPDAAAAGNTLCRCSSMHPTCTTTTTTPVAATCAAEAFTAAPQQQAPPLSSNDSMQDTYLPTALQQVLDPVLFPTAFYQHLAAQAPQINSKPPARTGNITCNLPDDIDSIYMELAQEYTAAKSSCLATGVFSSSDMMCEEGMFYNISNSTGKDLGSCCTANHNKSNNNDSSSSSSSSSNNNNINNRDSNCSSSSNDSNNITTAVTIKDDNITHSNCNSAGEGSETALSSTDSTDRVQDTSVQAASEQALDSVLLPSASLEHLAAPPPHVNHMPPAHKNGVSSLPKDLDGVYIIVQQHAAAKSSSLAIGGDCSFDMMCEGVNHHNNSNGMEPDSSFPVNYTNNDKEDNLSNNNNNNNNNNNDNNNDNNNTATNNSNENINHNCSSVGGENGAFNVARAAGSSNSSSMTSSTSTDTACPYGASTHSVGEPPASGDLGPCNHGTSWGVYRAGHTAVHSTAAAALAEPVAGPNSGNNSPACELEHQFRTAPWAGAERDHDDAGQGVDARCGVSRSAVTPCKQPESHRLLLWPDCTDDVSGPDDEDTADSSTMVHTPLPACAAAGGSGSGSSSSGGHGGGSKSRRPTLGGRVVRVFKGLVGAMRPMAGNQNS